MCICLRLYYYNKIMHYIRTNVYCIHTHFHSYCEPVQGIHMVLVQRTLSEVNFENRKQALLPKPKANKRILPFVTQYHPAVPNVKQILMKHWHLIEEQPLLKEIFKQPPLISYKKGRSLKDILVRSKL